MRHAPCALTSSYRISTTQSETGMCTDRLFAPTQMDRCSSVQIKFVLVGGCLVWGFWYTVASLCVPAVFEYLTASVLCFLQSCVCELRGRMKVMLKPRPSGHWCVCKKCKESATNRAIFSSDCDTLPVYLFLGATRKPVLWCAVL